MPRPATTRLVAVAYLKELDGIDNNVATSLPEDVSQWSTNGFVVVDNIVGGTPDSYVPLRMPVVSVECFAVNPNNKNPPWDKADELAEYIRAGTLDPRKTHQPLTLRTGYEQAHVLSAYFASEPRPIYNDEGNYARVQFDLALRWVSLG